MGTPPYVPTAEQREQVLLLTGFGSTHKAIARRMGISQKTLERHYPQELKDGVEWVNQNVAGMLYRQAMSGNIAALIFWMKTRARWNETQHPPNSIIYMYPNGVEIKPKYQSPLPATPTVPAVP